MSKPIELAKKYSDQMSDNKSKITGNLKEILISLSKRKNGIVIEIPWEADIDGKYTESITVLAVKITKERLYFMNPVKVSQIPCEIKAEDKKGLPRRIEKDGLESISLLDLFKINKVKPIKGII